MTAIEARPAGSYREVELGLTVCHREIAADGVVVLTLADPAGADLPEWTAGAHIDLMLGSALVRQYSLCGDTSDRTRWRVGVLLDPASRGGSRYVHESLTERASVRVRGPRNHFPLVRAPRYVFVAGGIGITPILPMIDAAEAAGADWRLYYAGRSRSTMAFADDLARYGERVRLAPADDSGRLDLAALFAEPEADTLVYCCGPESLSTGVERACAGWPPGSVHTERFAAKQIEPGPEPDTGFVVECQRSGVEVLVPPELSIYDAVEAAGVEVLGSCMEGVCGTCECDVLGGDPDHRDSVLSDAEKAEGNTIMICVSRSRSERLVLDL